MSGPAAARLAAAVQNLAERKGAASPAVRGADARTGIVTAVGTGTVDVGTIRARRLDSYTNPAVGDQVLLVQGGSGNWWAAGRTSSTADTEWATYTPAWTAATTNPTLGNGTMIGRYSKVGRAVTAHINLTAGSTTTFGSGAYSLSMPVQSANAGCTYVGNAHLLQSGSRYGGQFLLIPASLTGQPSFPTSATTASHSLWNPTTPITFASGGVLRITITYESAT